MILTSNFMKKIIFSVIGILGVSLLFSGTVFAQNGHTTREEAEGKIVWEKLQAKQTTCANLSDENFGTLGEYFMGRMMGGSHEAMNNMITQMMGEKSEEQMHVVMGKRMSGCDKSAELPGGWMPMMQTMTRGMSNNNSMMNFGLFGFFGWIFMLLWWVLIIAGVVALVKWLMGQYRGDYHNREKSASTADVSSLGILKERYAKGEINKEEFERMKKDLA